MKRGELAAWYAKWEDAIRDLTVAIRSLEQELREGRMAWGDWAGTKAPGSTG